MGWTRQAKREASQDKAMILAAKGLLTAPKATATPAEVRRDNAKSAIVELGQEGGREARCTSASGRQDLPPLPLVRIVLFQQSTRHVPDAAGDVDQRPFLAALEVGSD